MRFSKFDEPLASSLARVALFPQLLALVKFPNLHLHRWSPLTPSRARSGPHSATSSFPSTGGWIILRMLFPLILDSNDLELWPFSCSLTPLSAPLAISPPQLAISPLLMISSSIPFDLYPFRSQALSLTISIPFKLYPFRSVVDHEHCPFGGVLGVRHHILSEVGFKF